MKMTELTHTWDVPVGSFTFPNPSEDTRNQLIGMGLREEVGRKNTFLGNPNATNLAAIFRLGPITARASPGNVTIDGYLAYITAIKGFQFYSSYARYELDVRDHHNIIVSPSDIDVTEGKTVAVKRHDGSVFNDWDNAKEKDEQVVRDYTSVVIAAWDSSCRIKGEYTSDGSDITAAHGAFFPYFPGMCTIDKSTIKHVFESLFTRMIGTTTEKAADFFARFKQGCNNFAFTSAGRSLSHLYRGIQLSIQNQLPIKAVIVNSVYHGFVLEGEFEVNLFGRKYTSYAASEIVRHIGEINRTKRVLGEILTKINAPVKSDGNRVHEYSLTDIDTSRKFMTVYASIDKSLYINDELKALRALIDEVQFTDNFAAPNAKMISDFVHFVDSGDHTILQNYPAYLFNGYFEMTDRISIGLGIFGPNAPSLSYGDSKDQIFTLPRDSTAEDPNMQVTNGQRALRLLPFKVLGIRNAQVQWKQLFEQGEIRIPRGRPNKNEFTDGRRCDFRITADTQFMTIYQKIKNASATMRDTIRLGKRAGRDDDNNDRGDIKRSKKDAMELEI